jgi:hypothetical protein
VIANLDTLSPDQLRDAVRTLMADVASKSAEIAFKQATIDKLAHEMAVLKRLKFAAKSEAFSAEQKSLIEETIDTDLVALALEIEQRAPRMDSVDKQQPKRVALPADLPRAEHPHEPENTACSCGCRLLRIGEDVAEKLDYVPGVVTPSAAISPALLLRLRSSPKDLSRMRARKPNFRLPSSRPRCTPSPPRWRWKTNVWCRTCR